MTFGDLEGVGLDDRGFELMGGSRLGVTVGVAFGMDAINSAGMSMQACEVDRMAMACKTMHTTFKKWSRRHTMYITQLHMCTLQS